MKDNGWTKAFWGDGNYQIENDALKIKRQVLSDDSVIVFVKDIKRDYLGYTITDDAGKDIFFDVHQVKPVESSYGNEYAIRVVAKGFSKNEFDWFQATARAQESERQDVLYKENVMTKAELDQVLAAHQYWHNQDCEGWENMWADLSNQDLRGMDLRNVDLSHAKLSGADLRNADLSGANLVGAILFFTYLSGANLSGANLFQADLCGADLRNADLKGANLVCANLFVAELSGADLTSADLEYANLEHADFHDANLHGANLNNINSFSGGLNANFKNADLTGTVFDESTEKEPDCDKGDDDGFEPNEDE